MNKTFDTVALRLTPLTPIHIGCGEDFEPTNYVIDDGVLYHFDPARAVLGEADRRALLNALGKGGAEALQRLQKFFHDRRQLFAGAASGCVAVARGVAEQYDKRIGQIAQYEANGGRVGNQLEIERTSHHPHTGTPYLPGSSLKGAMRTAWLDQLNRGQGKPADERSANDVEKRLVGGAFHTDPSRLLRVADASGESIVGKVYFSTNHKKREVRDKSGQVVTAKGPCTRRESLVGGQHRALAGELRFDLLPGLDASDKTPKRDHRIAGFEALAQACNRYYLPRLARECEILDQRHFGNPGWLAAFGKLMNQIKPQLDAGALMLLRVGRHSGAESVTLDGIRSIRIMTGKGQPPQYSDVGAKTLWLAAEREDVTRGDLLPFGWLLVEPADSPEITALRAWCEAQPKPDLAAVRTSLARKREEAAREADRQAQIARERLAAEAAAARAEEGRKALRDRMTEQLRSVADFIAACEAKIGKDPFTLASGLFQKASNLSKAALAEGSQWSAEDKLALAAAFETWLPKVIEKLDRKEDWKDARKKLKLAALRGQA